MGSDFDQAIYPVGQECTEFLPKLGDRLFVPTETGARLDPLGFTAAGQPRSHIGRWQLCSDAFLHAADRLVDSTSGAPHEDELIYPILALYRHHLELDLKWVIRLCAEEEWPARLSADPHEQARWWLLVADWIEKGDRSKSPAEQLNCWLNSEHDLKHLWEALAEVYRRFDRWASPECTQACANLISELNASDQNSQATRYPRDKRGNQTLAELDVVDLRILRMGVQKISHYLSAIAEQLGEDRGWEQEVNG